MRLNIPPIREPVFEAYVELPQKNGPPLRLPIKFEKTTRPWAEFFSNLSGQATVVTDFEQDPQSVIESEEAWNSASQTATLLAMQSERHAEIEKELEASLLMQQIERYAEVEKELQASLLAERARNDELEKMIEAASLSGVRTESDLQFDPMSYGAPAS